MILKEIVCFKIEINVMDDEVVEFLFKKVLDKKKKVKE